MNKIKSLSEFSLAIENGKIIELNTHHYDIWEKFDHDSYVLRDIRKLIEQRKLRIKDD